MGRHAAPPATGDDEAGALVDAAALGWAAFATVVAALVLGLAGPGWGAALAVAGLGAAVLCALAALARARPGRGGGQPPGDPAA